VSTARTDVSPAAVAASMSVAMPEPPTRHRSVRIPRLLRTLRGVEGTVEALEEVDPDGGAYLLVHSGEASHTGYGAQLAHAARSRGMRVDECAVQGNTPASVALVEAALRSSAAEVVVGVGGGRVVDVGKLAAARVGMEFVSVPTQAASDGICSPVAVMVDEDGRPHSVGARIPAGIIVDLDVLDRAPRTAWLSGLGDLVSNLSAVLDWRLAHETAQEPMDDFACLTAEAAAASVVEDDADLDDGAFRLKLIRGLILSGVSMEMAGSSRPASGAEHLISHALDRQLPRPRLHGLQVALATLAAYHLRGDDCHRLVRFYRKVGLPVLPGEIGISVDELMDAVGNGRGTRPGRWTILDAVTEAGMRDLGEVYRRNGEGTWF
jgi:glycerol-1-phosphate dehydrogenase [NAD(P)+]